MSGKIFAPDKTTGLVNDPNDPTNKYGDVTGTTVGNKRGLDVAIIGGSPLSELDWDACDIQQTSATVRTYVFKTGGLAGTTVATCTITFTDSTRSELDSVVWT